MFQMRSQQQKILTRVRTPLSEAEAKSVRFREAAELKAAGAEGSRLWSVLQTMFRSLSFVLGQIRNLGDVLSK